MYTEVSHGVAYTANPWGHPRFIGWARRPPRERREGKSRRFKFRARLDARKLARELSQ